MPAKTVAIARPAPPVDRAGAGLAAVVSAEGCSPPSVTGPTLRRAERDAKPERIPGMSGLTRREALAAAAASGTAYPLSRGTASAAVSTRLDFSTEPPGEGWGRGWASPGVANFRRAAGEGLLEAGSDVFPNDPRPVAFAVDRRFRDGTVRATITPHRRRAGRGAAAGRPAGLLRGDLRPRAVGPDPRPPLRAPICTSWRARPRPSSQRRSHSRSGDGTLPDASRRDTCLWRRTRCGSRRATRPPSCRGPATPACSPTSRTLLPSGSPVFPPSATSTCSRTRCRRARPCSTHRSARHSSMRSGERSTVAFARSS